MTEFRVLVVCTANHCRSPIAEQLLTFATAERFGIRNEWRVESAGTDIPGPWPLHASAAAVLAERIPVAPEHYSRQLRPAMIQRADLVLTATRQHRGVVVSTVPAAVGRTFTILQFARLCDQVAPIRPVATGRHAAAGDQGRELVIEAKLARSSLQPVPGEQDDLPDPMGRGMGEFEVCADRLQAAIARILRPLA